MKKKMKAEDYIGKYKIIDDFLPPPHRLVLKEDTIKITLSLSKNSIDFFKREAKKCKMPYQKMIRNLLDQYTLRFKD